MFIVLFRNLVNFCRLGLKMFVYPYKIPHRRIFVFLSLMTFSDPNSKFLGYAIGGIAASCSLFVMAEFYAVTTRFYDFVMLCLKQSPYQRT